MKRHFDIEVLVGQSKMAAWIKKILHAHDLV
jgi:hypothetical protein